MSAHAPFGVVNRAANPAVRLLLRSPLHPLVSGQLALITVTGRRSGRSYTIPVGYGLRDDIVNIPVGWPARKRWWRNLRGDGAPVRVRLRGREYAGFGIARGDEREGVRVVVRLED